MSKIIESKLNVQILSHNIEPLSTVAMAGKLCYSGCDLKELYKKITPEDAERFVNMLSKIGHESPLEHCSFTFAIEGVSRSLTHQLVRHRIASFSQQSQRYVKINEGAFEYILPIQIKSNEKAKEIYIKAIENSINSYIKIFDILFEEKYSQEKAILKKGYGEKWETLDKETKFNILEKMTSKIEKEIIEDCRYLLPNATETKIIVTMNLRSLINFCKHRCCNRAQWEIRELAWQIKNLVTSICPLFGDLLNPSCVNGKCPEGGMNCGKPYKKE